MREERIKKEEDERLLAELKAKEKQDLEKIK